MTNSRGKRKKRREERKNEEQRGGESSQEGNKQTNKKKNKMVREYGATREQRAMEQFVPLDAVAHSLWRADSNTSRSSVGCAPRQHSNASTTNQIVKRRQHAAHVPSELCFVVLFRSFVQANADQKAIRTREKNKQTLIESSVTNVAIEKVS